MRWAIFFIWVSFGLQAYGFGLTECDSTGYGDLEHRLRNIHFCLHAVVKENEDLKAKVKDLEYRIEMKDVEDGTFRRQMDAKAGIRKK